MTTATTAAFAKGDRVRYRDTAAPLGGDGYAYGTVTRVGRKYVTVGLDAPVYGGTCRKLFGSFATETAFLPASLTKVA